MVKRRRLEVRSGAHTVTAIDLIFARREPRRDLRKELSFLCVHVYNSITCCRGRNSTLASGQCRFDDFYEWGWPCKFREAVDWDYVDPSQNNPAYALKLQAYNRLSTEHLSHLSNRIDPFLEKKLLKLHFLEARSFYVLDEIFFS